MRPTMFAHERFKEALVKMNGAAALPFGETLSESRRYSRGVLAQYIESWPATDAAAAVVTSDGDVVDVYGSTQSPFELASVTKLLTAYAALIALEEGVVDLEEEAGPPGATVRHLLAHTSGLAFADHTVVSKPGARRIYSSSGFEELAETISTHSGIAFADYLHESVFKPLAMSSTRLTGSPAAGATSTVGDLIRFATELQRPTLVDQQTLQNATHVHFPGLTGVLPGYGRQENNDWGLGFEIRAHKTPHWTGKTNSPQTFGHFGQSGTFLWVDPALNTACIVLTNKPFGQWAIDAWPELNDAVVTSVS